MVTVIEVIWHILSVVFCSAWIFVLVYSQRAAVRIPWLRDARSLESLDDRDWAPISIIVPACNEAENLEVALTLLLQLDYPAFEVIVINDRSTDGTGEIIDRIAATDQRVRAVHVKSLPKGWLGKVHAMHLGVEEANNDWFLFTDADVQFQPDVLKCAMAYARQHGVDHLACIPEIRDSSAFWLAVAIRAFFVVFSVATRLLSVNRKGSRWPIGIGAFNLVEAGAFGRTPGFEWLRMEPADDVGLGLMLKNAGARTHLVNGDRMLSVPWYATVKEMIRGLEKNGFGPGANYRYWKQFAIVIVLWGLALVPPLGLAAGIYLADPLLLGTGSFAMLATVAGAFSMPRKSAKEILAYLLLPVGVLILSYILLRAAFLCLRNGGVDWRGTRYSVTELRAGQRVRF